MGDDLSTGAKIGIGLVILCFLIAVVLALLMVVKNITNSGASQMEAGLGQMMSTTYDDYDQKVVTGTKVKTALKLFQGENIGIIVNSRYKGNDTPYNYGLLLSLPSSTSGGGGTATSTKNESHTSGAGTVYSNNVPIDANASGAYKYGEIPVKLEFNLNTKPLDAAGYDTYVRDNAKYMAYLIKDGTETITGIYFVLQ